VSVIESSDAVNAGMAKQADGRRLAFCESFRLKLALWLVGLLIG